VHGVDRSSFEGAISKTAGEAVGELVVWTTFFVFVATFALVLWFFLRKNVRLQFRFHSGEPSGARPFATEAGSGPGRAGRASHSSSQELPRLHPAQNRDERRRQFLESLDTAQGYLGKLLIGLLHFAWIAATVLMALLVFTYPEDGNRDFMLFYGGAVYLLAIVTIAARIAGLRRQLGVRPDPVLQEQLESLRSRIDIRVESEPEMVFVDEAALARAREHVASGGSIDEACELVHPGYRELSEWARGAFRNALGAALRT
jgi:hypothetical protein